MHDQAQSDPQLTTSLAHPPDDAAQRQYERDWDLIAVLAIGFAIGTLGWLLSLI